MSISFAQHYSLQEIINLEQEWKQLHPNSSQPSIYNSFDFIYQSIQHFQHPNITPFILTIRLDNELIGLFYLQSDIEKRMGIKVRVLEFCALDEIDKPSPVIHVNHLSKVWGEFFNYLSQQTDWDIVSLIEQEESALKHLIHHANENGFIHRINPDKQGPILHLNQSWDKFWLDHKKMRKKLYKIEKDFKDKVDFKIKDGSELLDDYINIEQSSWKSGKLGISKSPKTLDFYQEIAFNLRHNFVIGILYIDGKPVSGEIAYTQNDRVYFCHGCYSEEYNQYSPGMISTTLFIKHFMNESDYNHGDFLCGYAGYLNAWSDQIIQTHRIDIYRPNWVTRLFFTLRLINKITPTFMKRFAKVTHALLKTNP